MSSDKTHVYNSGKGRDGKKVSWIYRRKKKLQKTNTQTKTQSDNSEQQDKKTTIIVRNLPFKATEQDVKQFYNAFGKIKEVNLPKHPDGKPVGCGFIEFQNVEDASRAIFNTNKKEFLGRIISSSWVIPKSKFCEKLENESGETIKKDNDQNESTSQQEKPVMENDDHDESSSQLEHEKDKRDFHKSKSQIKQNNRKLQKEKNRKKRARVIIRNLSFQVTEEILREHFSRHGEIEDVQILTNEDGKKRGCAFIQFELVQSAAKAIHHANLKPLLDRPIVVDWAVPKNKFHEENKDSAQIEIKEEIKEEKESDTEHSNQNDSAESENTLNKSVEELGSDTEMKDKSDGSDVSQDESIDEEEDAVDNEDKKEIYVEEEEEEEEKEKEDVKRTRYQSHDVGEGKTIFLKNVPFSVDNDELKRYMERFGPLYYALVCIDRLTEHSRGTAFVKFKYVVDAEKCLSAGTVLEMEGQIIEAYKALERDEAENKAGQKLKRERDSRNLYLVKEGAILAGSPAAVGVSPTDMAKRLQLEQWKTQMLRNLNMFVARTRLVVHNLPTTIDDVKLRKIFENHSPPKAVIREARVMRNLRNLDGKGLGISKEYGFVSYTTHEDALAVLRNINNNPNVFSANRRPIVAFSIENRIMVNAKQKRIEKSREHNPLYPGNKAKRKNADINESTQAKKPRTDKTNKPDVKPFAGSIGKPGESKFRSKFNLKNQAVLHNETVKKVKKQKKSAKKLATKRKEESKKRQEIKVKQGSKINPDDVHFNKLVNSYKNKLQSMDLKKSKWYET